MRHIFKILIILLLFGFIYSCEKENTETPIFEVKFNVTNGVTPITDAFIFFNNTHIFETDVNGNCSTEIKAGDYFYSVSSEGFNEIGPRNFTVAGEDLLIEVTMDTAIYTVTFNTDGGSLISEQQVSHGSTAVEPATEPEKEGWSFKGWYINETKFNFSTPITKDTTITAKWTEIFMVTFMLNENTIYEEKEVIDGEFVERPQEDPWRVDWEFNGWYLNESEFDFTSPVTSDLTIMANWLELFTVRFDTDGGSYIAPIRVVDGDTIDISEVNTTKEGFSLEGWYLDGVKFDMSTPIVEDITLKAKWGYAVVFKSGTEDVVNFVFPPENKVAIPNDPINNYSTFVRWFTRGEDNGIVEFNENSIITSDTTVFAEWELQDIENNTYKAVTIGNQVWMAENLKTTKYNDGAEITLIEDNSEWEAMSSGAYCYYNNNLNNESDIYGALYNWYAVNTERLCPEGWHEPAAVDALYETDWTPLRNYLKENYGDELGKYLKASTGWLTFGGITNTNFSGFTALPGGYRTKYGDFKLIEEKGYWWCVDYDIYSNQGAFYNSLHYSDYYLNQILLPKNSGLSVRCVRD